MMVFDFCCLMFIRNELRKYLNVFKLLTFFQVQKDYNLKLVKNAGIEYQNRAVYLGYLYIFLKS